MRTLNEILPGARIALVASGLASVIILSVLTQLPGPYSDAAANLALQLPQQAAGFAAQLELWSVQPAALTRYFQLDFIFPIAYAVFLALLCGLLAQVHRDAGRRSLAPIGLVLSWAVLACIPLDWLENRWLARAIDQAPDAAQWYLQHGQHYSAAPKYLLLSLALAWLLFALLGLLGGRRNSTSTHLA
jgi:hypothetical protein